MPPNGYVFAFLFVQLLLFSSSLVIISGHSFSVYNKAKQKPQQPIIYGFKSKITNVIRSACNIIKILNEHLFLD